MFIENETIRQEAESEPEKLVTHYQQETGFPESAPKIRAHLEQMIEETVKETGVPIVLATCNSHSSLGDAEGYSNAMPGSDIDGLLFLTASPINEDQRQAFSQGLRENTHDWLVDLHQSDFTANSFISLQEIKQAFASRSGDSFDGRVSRKLTKILHGTVLYQDGDFDLDSFRTNSEIQQRALPPADWEVNQMNPKKREKYQARAQLAENFDQMDPSTQALIIKLHLYFVSSILSVIDPHVDGPDKEELDKLHDLGLLRIEEDFDGREIYRPKWLPQPHIYDIIRMAVLGQRGT